MFESIQRYHDSSPFKNPLDHPAERPQGVFCHSCGVNEVKKEDDVCEVCQTFAFKLLIPV